MNYNPFRSALLSFLLIAGSATLSAHTLQICKTGATSQVTGTFSFAVTGIAGPIYVGVGQCSSQISLDGVVDIGSVATVSEAKQSGLTMTGYSVSPSDHFSGASLTNQTVSFVVGGEVIVTFTNSVTPTTEGAAGCTPGFYKRHLSAYPSQYPPTATLGSVFDLSAFPALAGVTLNGAMDFKGGPTLQDAASVLLRQATAALLNAADNHYPLSTSSIIAATNSALASGNRTTILDLADYFDQLNNQCDASLGG